MLPLIGPELFDPKLYPAYTSSELCEFIRSVRNMSYTLCSKVIIGKHLILKMGVQLVWPATQEMQESRALEFKSSFPPQTTSFPPGRRERL